ncbi:MAG: cell division protein ZapA [Dysgonamonadaceae bacterium]|jgi:cell division protein ZapA|nr:cell division protein ZapA [Dysgonamonadaceae bacterium]
MNDEFGIKVNIAGKDYNVRCLRSEELLYRKAAKQIRDKILQYRVTYPNAGLEEKDFLAMVALQLSLGDVTMKVNEDVSPLFEQLGELDLHLDEFIKSNK